MTGQMHVIIVGNGTYRHWVDLQFIQPHNDRFADYVREQWPGARIVEEGAEKAWTAADIREKLEGWIADCGKDDDVVLLWSGHGYGENSQHRLITYTSPAPGQGLMSSANTVKTQELADYLIKCPARRIVVLLNTCWSGDGGQELAAVIDRAVADSPPAEQARSMVIISSARREESVDGAFISSVLRVLHSPVPPIGLAQEHAWPASERYLTPERLCAGVNVLLEASDHQAQLSTVYGIVGDFFLRANQPVKVAELPPGVVARLQSDFPGQLPSDSTPWTVAKLRAAITQHASCEKSGELGYRLERLAVGVAALELLERWLGPGPGLANRLAPAWQSVLRPLHRIPRPVERFGYIEQVVLHGGPEQVIEFVARVIRDAGDDPCHDRLYQWAEQELRVDRKAVDDALARIDSSQEHNRLIIHFGMAIAADGEDDALPESVVAWLDRPGEPGRERTECSFGPDGDVAEIVARLVAWARAQAGHIGHVDVALPVSLLHSRSRPENARLVLRGTLTKPVAACCHIAVRWADRITHKDLRVDGLSQGKAIANLPEALCWVTPETYAEAQHLYDDLRKPARAVAFTFRPRDLSWFCAALLSSPYVLWIDDDTDAVADIQSEILPHWHELPRRLSEAYGSPQPTVIRSVRAVWDDPDWLEKVVPNLPDPNYRLSV
jgi:Caspase domain